MWLWPAKAMQLGWRAHGVQRDPKRLPSLSQLLALEVPGPGDIFAAHLSPFIILPAPRPIMQLFIYSSKACLLWVKSCGRLWIFLPPECLLGTG